MVDYLAAVELLIIPFVLRLGTSAPLAKWLAVDTGLAVILVSLLTDYKLGLVRIIPFRGVSGMKTTSILIGLAGLMATALVAAEVQKHASAATSDQSTQTVVDAQGNLRVPEDYRTAYQFLGAWAIAADQSKGSQHATEPMTTGTVSHAQTLKGWFVMVRDSKNIHPGNKLWGDG